MASAGKSMPVNGEKEMEEEVCKKPKMSSSAETETATAAVLVRSEAMPEGAETVQGERIRTKSDTC